MHKYYKKIVFVFSILLGAIILFNVFPSNASAQFRELLWQRVFWGYRDSSTNDGVNSMAVYKGKLYIGTYNLLGGEVWYFDGKEWKKSSTEEVPISELPAQQQFLYALQSPYVPSAIAALALANALSLISLTSLLPYLAYLWQLFTQPFLFFSKKKREWGVVYDSITKQPVDLAIVRLFDSETKKLVETRVTNLEGKYLLLVDPDKKYNITASKAGYVFPTKLMAKDINDKNFDNLYHGEEFKIEVETEQGFVAYNIPLDPQEGFVAAGALGAKVKTDISSIEDYNKLDEAARKERNKKILRRSRLKSISRFVAYLGPLLGLTSFILNPGLFTYLLLMLHVVVLLLFRRLAAGKKVKPWGKVYDTKDLRALPQSVVRVFDTTYGRLMQMYVTKGDGRYGFLIGDGVDSKIVPSKDGYSFPEKSIKIEGGEDVEKDIGMKKIK